MSAPPETSTATVEAELPPVDATTAPWWDATRERRLLIQSCIACGHLQHYPRALCTGCGGTELGWVEAAGTGTVDSFSVVHRALPGFEAPYVVARVRLTEGVVLLSNVVAPTDDATLDHEALRCDQPVRLRWRPLSDGRALPVFAPVSADLGAAGSNG
jgi:uncharacterized protein